MTKGETSMRRKHIDYAIASLLMASAGNVSAAGFALIEQSGSGMGNAYAGGAAIAEDASTIFFNPAGMTYLPDSQLVIAAHAIKPSAKFDNDGSHRSAVSGGLATPGGDGGDAGDWAFVPNMFYAKALSENLRLGIGISAPFGLKTEYNDTWVGRYQAIKSDLKTININPSVAFKASEQLSIGFGISAMRAEAELTNAVDFGSICAALLGGCGIGATFQQNDGRAKLKGDDWGFGWNVGLLFSPNSDTRIGLAYRSQVHHELDGDVKFSGILANSGNPLLAAFRNGSITANLTTPSSFSASLFHQVNDQWDIMADATWTRWSNFDELVAVRDSGAVVTDVPQKWDNTMRYSVGANYRYSDALKLRAGLAYDESPASDRFRTPRIPDEDRVWLSLGASYQISPMGKLDVGYTHIFIQDASLNKTNDTSSALLRDTLIGDYDSDVNILSVQYTHTF
jgi:long-chain fatty acid transport protein